MSSPRVIEIDGTEAVVQAGISKDTAKELVKDMKKSLEQEGEGHKLELLLTEENTRKLINDLIEQVHEE